MKLTKEQVRKVVEEIYRRHEIDLADARANNYDLPRELLTEKKQGMYGALMALSSNWPEVVRWLDDIEEEFCIADEHIVDEPFEV